MQMHLFGPGGTIKSTPFTDRRTVPEWQRVLALRPARNAAMDEVSRFNGLWERVRGVRMDRPDFYPEKEWPARAKALGYDAVAHAAAKAEFKKLDAEYQAAHDAWGLVYLELY